MGLLLLFKGKIKNNSDNDITTASFIMKLFGENGRMIAEFDFQIRKIASNAIKSFEETVRGVLPFQISRYEIKHRSSFQEEALLQCRLFLPNLLRCFLCLEYKSVQAQKNFLLRWS